MKIIQGKFCYQYVIHIFGDFDVVPLVSFFPFEVLFDRESLEKQSARTFI